MVLRRLGNKQEIASEILKHFTPHSVFIDIFFGAGGLFFAKPQVQHNFCNDIDNDVFNLFMVLKDKKEDFKNYIESTPISISLFDYWKKNEEKTDFLKAIRFIYLSNYSFQGAMGSLKLNTRNDKEVLISKIDKTFDKIKNVKFLCSDFRDVLGKISIEEHENEKCFIYADPPYLMTGDNYKHSFKEKDFTDLLDTLIASKMNFAVSEFDNPFVVEQATNRKLNVKYIQERRTLKSRNIEILITNYEILQTSLF